METAEHFFQHRVITSACSVTGAYTGGCASAWVLGGAHSLVRRAERRNGGLPKYGVKVALSLPITEVGTTHARLTCTSGPGAMMSVYLQYNDNKIMWRRHLDRGEWICRNRVKVVSCMYLMLIEYLLLSRFNTRQRLCFIYCNLTLWNAHESINIWFLINGYLWLGRYRC